MSGSIVVARVHDEFTLKRVRKEGSRVFLVPENAKYWPIEITDRTDFEFWGRVCGSVQEYCPGAHCSGWSIAAFLCVL